MTLAIFVLNSFDLTAMVKGENETANCAKYLNQLAAHPLTSSAWRSSLLTNASGFVASSLLPRGRIRTSAARPTRDRGHLQDWTAGPTSIWLSALSRTLPTSE